MGQIFGRSRQSFPAWRSFFDHPATKTTVLALQIVGATVALISLHNTQQSISYSNLLSAYSIVGGTQFPASMKWNAARFILQTSSTLSHFDTGCDSDNVEHFYDYSDRPCDTISNLDLEIGSRSADPFSYTELDYLISSRVIFEGGRWSGVRFYSSSLDNTHFSLDYFSNVIFASSKLRWSYFYLEPSTDDWDVWEQRSARLTDMNVSIEDSDVSGARLFLRNVYGFRIFNSNISDAIIFLNQDAIADSSEENWYLRGHEPTVNGEPNPSFAAFVCQRPPSVDERARGSSSCKPTR